MPVYTDGIRLVYRILVLNQSESGLALYSDLDIKKVLYL